MPRKNKRELKQKEEKATNGQIPAISDKDQKFIDLFSKEERFEHDLEILTGLQFDKGGDVGKRNAFTKKLLEAKKINLFKKLKEDLAPKTTIEEILIERIAMFYHWVFMAEVLMAGDMSYNKERDIETIEARWSLVERANNQLMRTIEALSNLRRSPITVVFKQPGQVNVGNQQVNVTKTNGKRSKKIQPK